MLRLPPAAYSHVFKQKRLCRPVSGRTVSAGNIRIMYSVSKHINSYISNKSGRTPSPEPFRLTSRPLALQICGPRFGFWGSSDPPDVQTAFHLRSITLYTDSFL